MLSFDALGISPPDTPATQPAAPPARTRRPGTSKATTSRAATDSGAEEEVGGRRKRTVWKVKECVALAKAWISVVEDPYVSANQVIDRMWYRISQSYLKWKPANGKAHDAHVQSEVPSQITPQLTNLAEPQMTQFMIETMEKWHAATDPM